MTRRAWILGTALTPLGCTPAVNKPPRRPFHEQVRVPAVEQYYVCDRCASLDGGIYGKSLVTSLRTDQGKNCLHAWRQISLEEFQKRATEQFNVDWSKEGSWKSIQDSGK